MKKVRVKLLKDLEIGKKNDEIEVSFERANYLIKVGGAVEWKQTQTEAQPFDEESVSDTGIKQPVKKANDGKGNTDRSSKGRKKTATSRKSQEKFTN